APGALTAMLNYYRAEFRARLSGRQRDYGAQVRVPTLLIWGAQDTALGKELTYGTERYASNLTVRYIADASHWVQQDTPDAVNRELTAFLTGPKPEQLRGSDVASDL
ncbi:MAG TPA: hypothetical protein VI299_21360, partial [Polyangiales bacterium]